jgi:hypothetical protein
VRNLSRNLLRKTGSHPKLTEQGFSVFSMDLTLAISDHYILRGSRFFVKFNKGNTEGVLRRQAVANMVFTTVANGAVATRSFGNPAQARQLRHQPSKHQDKGIPHMMRPVITRVLLAFTTIVSSLTPAISGSIATKYTWMVKSQTELSHAECQSAMRHDSNYWWSAGKCHMKYIRYAWGVATTDVPASEGPVSSLKKGALLRNITQYTPKEDFYCEHGGYCYPAKSIKLLGSIVIGRAGSPYSAGDETELYQDVGTTCELILADREAIIRADARDMLKDCH